MRSDAWSISTACTSLASTLLSRPAPPGGLVKEPGPLGAALAPPSILLIPKAQRSSMGEVPEGEGRGCEPVIKTESGRGVWLPPRPREGGTPTSLVGGVPLAEAEASSLWMIDSTLSMHMSTFSGLRSVVDRRLCTEPRNKRGVEVGGVRTGVNDPTTTVHIVEAKEDLFCNLANEMLGYALSLMTLDQAKEVFSEDFENHAYMGPMRTFMAKVVQEGDDMGTARMGLRGRGRGGGRGGGSGDEALKQLDLVEGSLCVAGGRLYDLEGYMTI